MLAPSSVLFSLSAYASVAHRYWNEAWSEAENREVYGAQASVEGQGSNLCLQPRWKIPSDQTEERFKALLQNLKARLDHRQVFASHATSVEFLTHHLADEAFAWPLPDLCTWDSLTLHESELLSCTVYREAPRRVELALRFHNLKLILRGERDPETQLLCTRAKLFAAASRATRALKDTLSTDAWGRDLGGHLQREIPQLFAVEVDLKRYEALRVVP